MKKILLFGLIVFSFMFINTSSVVNAESKPYWERYFDEKYPNGLHSTDNHDCEGCSGGNSQWKDIERTFRLEEVGGSGNSTPYLEAIYFTENTIFNNVEEVSVKSSDESIMTAEVKPYDFSKEKENFNKYVEEYNKRSLEEFNKWIGGDYSSKPTWWEFHNLEKEETWWEFYGFDTEPVNAVQVITHAKDLGNVTLTVSAKNKSDIHINWKMRIVDYLKQEGALQILNNLERYKDVIPGSTGDFLSNGEDYTFSVKLDKNEDISALINSLKGKDIKVLINGYVLNGKDITSNVNKGFTYDYSISMDTSINKDKINSLVELKDAIYVDFVYHGVLPTPYNLSIDVGYYMRSQYNKNEEEVKQYLKDKKFTLLYYNQDTNRMEVVKENLVVNENGKLNITFDHFSSYVLVPSDDYKMVNTSNNVTSNNAQTSSMDIVLYSVLAVSSLVGIVYIIVSKKRRKIA